MRSGNLTFCLKVFESQRKFKQNYKGVFLFIGVFFSHIHHGITKVFKLMLKYLLRIMLLNAEHMKE